MKMDLSAMKLQGNEIVLRQPDNITKSVLRPLGGVYEEFAKLIFLFDVSGSMSNRLSRDYRDCYLWTPELVASIRAKATSLMQKWERLNIQIPGESEAETEAELTDTEIETLQLRDPQRGPQGEMTLTCSDEELEERIIQHNLYETLGVPVNWEKHAVPPTRLELVKTLAKSEIASRFKKFPQSKIAVIPFGSEPAVIFDDGSPNDLWPKLDQLETGLGFGTNILAAIVFAVDVCRKKPSAVGVHHLILVSDGEDYNADVTIESWVPNLKASGVVLDYIHIGDLNSNSGLANACRALGGEFVAVNTAKAFEKKFVEAVSRKLLPSA